jgi:hypothetical protein
LRVRREANNPTPSKIFDTIFLPKPQNGNHAVTKTLAREFGFGCRNKRNCRRSAEDRDAWRPRIEESKTQVGL